jgi:hypothetical protein
VLRTKGYVDADLSPRNLVAVTIGNRHDISRPMIERAYARRGWMLEGGKMKKCERLVAEQVMERLNSLSGSEGCSAVGFKGGFGGGDRKKGDR